MLKQPLEEYSKDHSKDQYQPFLAVVVLSDCFCNRSIAENVARQIKKLEWWGNHH
jgi:hypothetical protein